MDQLTLCICLCVCEGPTTLLGPRSSLTVPDSQWLIRAAVLCSYLHPPAPTFLDPAPKTICVCVCVCVRQLAALRPESGQARGAVGKREGESRPIHRHKDIINQIGKWFEKPPLVHCVLAFGCYSNSKFVPSVVSVLCPMSILKVTNDYQWHHPRPHTHLLH